MTPRLKTALGLAVAPIAIAAALAGCSSPTPGGSTTPGSPAASSAGGTGELGFTTVEQVTAPILQKDPNCPFGQWDENSTGVDEKLRSAVTFFRQFDCYQSKDAVGGLPKRGQQSIYVHFNDPSAAAEYLAGVTSYPSLVAGNTVVVAGSGLESVDMPGYLGELKKACGCGEVRAAVR